MGLYSGYGWVIAALLAIFAAALGLSVMLSRFVLRSFFLPLGALTKRMEAFSGNTAPAEDIAASPYLEVDALNRAYTNMAGEISTLVNEAYTLKLQMCIRDRLETARENRSAPTQKRQEILSLLL